MFTAPIATGGTPVAPSCLGDRQTPDIPADGSTVIDSNGPLAGNQAALVAFLRFLNAGYGVTSVHLVGHSDGGLWSRAAITELRTGASPVAVTGLTTLGTPHTGSFGADLMVALVNAGGGCADLSKAWERLACDLAEVAVTAAFADLGEDVIEELTSSWLGGWNPTTSIGCPVTTLGGDHVGTDPGIGTYVNPNDGIVGMAAALNQGTWIPATTAAPFTPVGPPNGAPQLYDVVHSSSLSFLTPSTLLNSADVGAAVLASVQRPPGGPCAAATTRALRAAGADGARASGATAARRAADRIDTVIPLHHRAATRGGGGSLGRARDRDAIVLIGDARARCGGRELPAAPLMGARGVTVASGACARGVRTTGRALRLGRSDAHVRVTRDGRTLRWRVAGAPLRRVRAQVRVGGRWRPVSGRRATVPASAAGVALRVRGVDRRGRAVRGHARIPAA